VVFGGGLDTEYVEGKEVTILGKKYVFSSQDADLHNTSLVLFAAGQTESVAAGESTTVTIGGSDYVITVVGVNTAGDAATIDINGEAFDVNAVDDNYVQKGDLNLYIKSIRAFKFPAESGSVQLFVGSEKLTFDDSSGDITKGTDKIDGAVVSFPAASTSPTDDSAKDGLKLYEIQIEYKPDDTVYVKSGEAFTDPVFGAFKIAFGGIYPALDDSSKDLVEIEKSSSKKVKLKFTNKAGDLCSMDVYNTTAWAYGTKSIQVSNPAKAGGGGNALEEWNGSGNISEGNYFLVSQDEYSYILQYVSTDSTKQMIRLKDMCSGSAMDVSTITKFFYLGGKKYVFEVNMDSETIRVDQTGAGDPDGEQVPLYTQNKAKIELVKDVTTGNFTLTEAPFSEAGFQGASEVTLDIQTTLSAGEVDTIDVVNDTAAMTGDGLEPKDDTDYFYGVTASGTYVIRNSDSDTLDIYTPGVPTPVYVAVGANPTLTAGEGAEAGTVEQAVQIKNSVSKMESEVKPGIDAGILNRDLVLLGGPCANGLVATLLEMSSVSPQCSTDFKAEYPNEGVIKVVSNAFSLGKKALVVAGVDRDATRALAVKVMQGTVDYSA